MATSAEANPNMNVAPVHAASGSNEAAGYEGGNQAGGQVNLPPSLPQVHIPQNNGAAGNHSLTSPMGAITPGSAGVTRAAPEPNKKALYIGGLDPRVSEEVLRQIFETTGNVVSVKIIPDRTGKGFNYGFVEYDDPAAADRGMNTLNGRRIHQAEIRVNYAYQTTNTPPKEDTGSHYHLFVGDLSNEVNDEVLEQAFCAFGNLTEARVMWDMKTGRSRGYGFVAYRDQAQAQKALEAMDGEWLGSRSIRCNWANQKGFANTTHQQVATRMGASPQGFNHPTFRGQTVQSSDTVASQTPTWQTTVYIGNLSSYTGHNEILPLCQSFGYVMESRFQPDRGFGFVKMDSHQAASAVISGLNGYNINGRPLKCSWGKDRPPTGQFGEQYNANQGPNQQFAAAPGPYFNNQFNGQAGPMSPQGNPNNQNPAGYQNPQFAGNAGGYNRGAQGGQWNQQAQAQYNAGNPQANNGFNGGYQG